MACAWFLLMPQRRSKSPFPFLFPFCLFTCARCISMCFTCASPVLCLFSICAQSVLQLYSVNNLCIYVSPSLTIVSYPKSGLISALHLQDLSVHKEFRIWWTSHQIYLVSSYNTILIMTTVYELKLYFFRTYPFSFTKFLDS